VTRDIKLKWFYPYPAEAVWEALTDPELAQQWSSISAGFKPVIGHRWMAQSKPRKKMNWDGKMYFEVLELIPLQKLSYSFKGGPSEGVFNLDTIVTWTLISRPDGTELHLEHTGFKGMLNLVSSFIMEQGWKKNVGKKFTK
jgi:uncharacterized protein YndB with AHSA1/START domain